jgi:hypothetical protein
MKAPSTIEAPSSKLQAPEKHQIPSSKPEARLVFGAWIFSGAWSLELGVFSQHV